MSEETVILSLMETENGIEVHVSEKAYDNFAVIGLIERIKLLQVQPRPSGSEKLAGRLSLYRVRQGNYRVIYSVDDQSHVVDIIKVGHRRDVYR